MTGAAWRAAGDVLRGTYRRLDGIPYVGRHAKKLADVTLRPAYLRLHRDVALMRKRYGRGAYAAVRRNTRAGYERLYGDAALIDEYLSTERLAFYDAVADVCVAQHPASVVDVGCGAGNLLVAIAARAGGPVELVGIDYAASGIARLTEALPDAEGIVADIWTLDLGERTFELVVCSEVLEHLESPERALRILDALRRPGGAIVVTVPDGAHDTYEGHVNFWTDTALSAFLAPVGVVDVRRVGPSDDLLAIVR